MKFVKEDGGIDSSVNGEGNDSAEVQVDNFQRDDYFLRQDPNELRNQQVDITKVFPAQDAMKISRNKGLK